jgi:voltage-gated potassium channel
VVYALLALFAAVFIVYVDCDSYTGAQDGQLSFLDCVHYATVSLSTTGYGDITPITPEARLINVVVITPLRLHFESSGLARLRGEGFHCRADQHDQERDPHTARPHVGYGTTGRTAIAAMVGDEVAPVDIVVVDESAAALEGAKSAGLLIAR